MKNPCQTFIEEESLWMSEPFEQLFGKERDEFKAVNLLLSTDWNFG